MVGGVEWSGGSGGGEEARLANAAGGGDSGLNGDSQRRAVTASKR